MRFFALLPVLAIVLCACWGDDTPEERIAASTETTSPRVAAPAPPPQAAGARPAWRWTWPAESGPARSLLKDRQACLDRADKSAPPLNQFKSLWACLEEYGWRRSTGGGTAKLTLKDLWAASNRAAKRDLATDDRACKLQADKGARGLTKVKQYLDCMTSYGWEQKQDGWQRLRARHRR